MHRNGNSVIQVAWQIYAALFCSAQFFGSLDMELNAKEIALLAWGIMGCVPLLGFAFKFKAAVLLIWKLYFLLLILAAGVFSAFLLFGAITSGFNEELGRTALVMVFQVPFWYAVWAYAHRSTELWVRNA